MHKGSDARGKVCVMGSFIAQTGSTDTEALRRFEDCNILSTIKIFSADGTTDDCSWSEVL